mgnify:CR=1 FL=1|tara:strand:+ start:401 stop:598 length:198 start_codon:yes stop_codon:yes gene_type:complete
MGRMGDMLIEGSTDKEMNKKIDSARGIDSAGYISFLEEQLKIRDKSLKDLKSSLRKMEVILKKNK